MALTPFVVGQWVRGDKFYGRQALISEILEGPRNWLWILGTRRIGKTSLLKQIAHLTISSESGFFPVFWDFQGAADPRELHFGFRDSLLDTENSLAALGISLSLVEDDDLFASLSKLRRHLRLPGRRLLLLCDEVEELIKLSLSDPFLLGKLRRALQSAEDIRSVMASTIRLCVLLDQQTDTSPLLHGFTPPLYIHNLTDNEARALIRQSNLPDISRPAFDEQVVESISLPIVLPAAQLYIQAAVPDALIADEQTWGQTDLLAYVVPTTYHPLLGSIVRPVYKNFIKNQDGCPTLALCRCCWPAGAC